MTYTTIKTTTRTRNSCYSKGSKTVWEIVNPDGTPSGYTYDTKKEAVAKTEFANAINWNGNSDLDSLYLKSNK